MIEAEKADFPELLRSSRRLQNMNLADHDGRLNLAGVMLFAERLGRDLQAKFKP